MFLLTHRIKFVSLSHGIVNAVQKGVCCMLLPLFCCSLAPAYIRGEHTDVPLSRQVQAHGGKGPILAHHPWYLRREVIGGSHEHPAHVATPGWRFFWPARSNKIAVTKMPNISYSKDHPWSTSPVPTEGISNFTCSNPLLQFPVFPYCPLSMKHLSKQGPGLSSPAPPSLPGRNCPKIWAERHIPALLTEIPGSSPETSCPKSMSPTTAELMTADNCISWLTPFFGITEISSNIHKIVIAWSNLFAPVKRTILT